MKKNKRKKQSKRYIFLLLLLSFIFFISLNYFDGINLGAYIPGKQQVESVETKGSEMSIRGYQLYNNYDMSKTDNVEHILFFKGATNYEIPVANEKREDITKLFIDHKTNYDYAGYQTAEGFYDISSIKEGKYVLNIRTKIIDNDIDFHQKATLDGEWEDQDLSKDLAGGFIYHFYVLDSKIHLEKEALGFSNQQMVEELTTKGSEISIKGYHFFKYEDMSKSDNVEHTMFFQETTLGKQHPIMIDATKRSDITETLAKDNSNYDYAGYQTDGFYNLDSIPNGNYVLKIRTKLLDAKIDETQIATFDMKDKDLTKHSVDGNTYRFYIQEQKIYLEKSKTILTGLQEIENITTKGSLINIEGFQLYEYYDMSNASEVKQTLFFEEMDTKVKNQIDITNEKRTDITTRFETHGTNYDYSGYSTNGDFDLESIDIGTYKLKIRTQIASQNLDETQNAKHKDIKNQDISKHLVKNYTYYFYIKNNEVYLEKEKMALTVQQEVEAIHIEAGNIAIRGFQFYEFYEMSDSSKVQQTMLFINTADQTENAWPLPSKKRTDITQLYDYQDMNYDYSGYETSGMVDLSKLPNGTYELNIKTEIPTAGIDEIQTATFDSVNKTLSKKQINYDEYHFYVKDKKIYFKRSTPPLSNQQTVESIYTAHNTIEFEGYQLYEYFDMSVQSNVKHELFFEDIQSGKKHALDTTKKTDVEHVLDTTNKKRTDIAEMYPSHATNYDYAGYETAGAIELMFLPNGVYSLNIRTSIIDQDLTKTQNTRIDLINQTLSIDTRNGYNYHFFVKNKEIYLEKTDVPLAVIQEIETIDIFESKIKIDGYQLFEYYDMGTQANINHDLAFVDTVSGMKYSIATESVNSPDVTKKYSLHKTNYDYAGYQLSGGTAIDTLLVPVGTYELYITTEIEDLDITQSKKANPNRPDQVLSNVKRNGFSYIFTVENDTLKFEKTPLPITPQHDVETFDAHLSTINVKGFQLYEYYEMGDKTNIQHDLFFEETTNGTKYSIPIDNPSRPDITNTWSGHNTNYEYAGYETTGGTNVNIRAITPGIHELKINTRINKLAVDETETATTNLSDGTISNANTNGFSYHFYVQANKIYLEKTSIPLVTRHQVEVVTSSDSGIYLKGYQMYDYYDMDESADIKHEIVFKGTNIPNEYAVPLDSDKRPDITANFPSHHINYDYVGYETTGGLHSNVRHVEEGIYELRIRTQVLDEGVDESEVTFFNDVDQTLSNDNFMGFFYHFYIQNNKIYLEKTRQPLAPVLEITKLDAFGSDFVVEGYHFFEFYPLANESDVTHTLVFKSETTGAEFPMSTKAVKSPHVTAAYNHETNYDYAGFALYGSYDGYDTGLMDGNKAGRYKLMIKIEDHANGFTRYLDYEHPVESELIAKGFCTYGYYTFEVKQHKLYLIR